MESSQTNSTIGELDLCQLYHGELLMCWDVVYTLYLRIRRNVEHSVTAECLMLDHIHLFTCVDIWWRDCFIATRCHHRYACLPLSVTLTSTSLVLSLVSSKRMPAVFLLYRGKMQLYRSGVNCILQSTVHNRSSEQFAVFRFKRTVFVERESKLRKKNHTKKRLLENSSQQLLQQKKCSHPYYCQYSDGNQMNGALYLICTGPLQLNQNQHVFNEFDKTDAM